MACEDNFCDCKPVGSDRFFVAGYDGYKTIPAISSFPHVITTCAAPATEVTTADPENPTGIDRHMLIHVGDTDTHIASLTITDLDGGNDVCTGLRMELHGYLDDLTNLGFVNSGTGLVLSGYESYYLALKNTASEDCLVTITIN